MTLLYQKPKNTPYDDRKHVKITPYGENTLDHCRIFSREKYRYDFNGKIQQADKLKLTYESMVATHDTTQKTERVLRDRNHLSVHENMFCIKTESPFLSVESERVGGTRGIVQTFSSASRKRMMELVAKQREGVPKSFVTLTYPDEKLFGAGGVVLSWSDDWKRDIEILRKRIERKFPRFLALWRLELQDRKSGQYIGRQAPHFHLLVWDYYPDTSVNDNEDFQEWLSRTWFEIIGSDLDKHREHGVHISKVRSTRHAMFYVSKYAAKLEEGSGKFTPIGRRWGRIGKFDTTPSIEVTLSDQQLIQFRRMIRKWLKSRGSDYYKRLKTANVLGFSVFGLGDNETQLDSQFNGDSWILKMIIYISNLTQNNDCAKFETSPKLTEFLRKMHENNK